MSETKEGSPKPSETGLPVNTKTTQASLVSALPKDGSPSTAQTTDCSINTNVPVHSKGNVSSKSVVTNSSVSPSPTNTSLSDTSKSSEAPTSIAGNTIGAPILSKDVLPSSSQTSVNIANKIKVVTLPNDAPSLTPQKIVTVSNQSVVPIIPTKDAVAREDPTNLTVSTSSSTKSLPGAPQGGLVVSSNLNLPSLPNGGQQPYILIPVHGSQGGSQMPQIFIPVAISQANQAVSTTTVPAKPVMANHAVSTATVPAKPVIKIARAENKTKKFIRIKKLDELKTNQTKQIPLTKGNNKKIILEAGTTTTSEPKVKGTNEVEIILPDSPPQSSSGNQDNSSDTLSNPGVMQDADVEVIEEVVNQNSNAPDNSMEHSTVSIAKDHTYTERVSEKKKATKRPLPPSSGLDNEVEAGTKMPLRVISENRLKDITDSLSENSPTKSPAKAPVTMKSNAPGLPVLLKNVTPPLLGYGNNPSLSIENENLKHEIRALKLRVQMQEHEITDVKKVNVLRVNEIKRLKKSLDGAKERLGTAKSKETVFNTKLKKEKFETRRLKSKKARMETTKEFLRESGLSEVQIRQVLYPDRKYHKHYTKRDIVMSVGLKNISVKSYEFVRKYGRITLPCQHHIPHYIRQQASEDGFQVSAFKGLKYKCTDQTKDKLFNHVVISFGERYVNTSLIAKSVTRKVLIVMLTGLTSPWKQPIYYKFRQSMTKELLMEAIQQCTEANLVVRAVTCDLDNSAVLSEMDLLQQPSFPDPTEPERKIYFMPDIPDLMTRIRNHVFTDGLLINSWKKTGFDFVTLVKGDFVPILTPERVAQKLCPKLRDKHINTRIIGREDVALAAQVLSATTAEAIRKINKENVRKMFKAEVIEIIDKWFDVCNSKKEEDPKPERCAFGKNSEAQLKALDDMNTLINNLSVINHTNNRVIHNSVNAVNSTLRELSRELSAEGVNHFITRRLNQESVEMFAKKVKEYGKVEKSS